MADVRLTATNPEDSSVVPVACDAAGRLLLEEPQVIEGPPGQQGPPGEQGPPGQDGQDGDPFSGNFAGDVTFGGSALFAGRVEGELFISRQGTGAAPSTFIGGSAFAFETRVDGSAGGVKAYIEQATGNAYFKGDVTFGGSAEFAGGDGVTENQSFGINAFGRLSIREDASVAAEVFTIRKSTTKTIVLENDGSVTFAAGKAGFTQEGYLWCTTRRGDTVILDATSNGLASWVEYTPNTRIEEIRDKLDAYRGDTGEMPADTQ